MVFCFPQGTAGGGQDGAKGANQVGSERRRDGPNRRPVAPTSWDALAQWYDGWMGEEGSLHHRAVAVPVLLALLDAEPGEQILDVGAGQGVLAPAGTPRAVVAKLNAEISKVLHSAEMKDRFSAQGADVVTQTPDEMGRFIGTEKARWAAVVKAANVKP